jgi:ribosomal protein S18 acetylase RimI-like enzyme
VNNTPAALSISELDPTIKEGALEWIQVHPNYQGHGLGKNLVYLTLNKLSNIAEFATVGGKNPIALKLYQSCGFNNKENFYVFH